MGKHIMVWLGRLVLILVFISAITGFYVRYFLPDIPAKDLTVEASPERITRGAYLANHVLVCIDCHSRRDWTRYSGPIIPGTEGMGGEIFDQNLGLPGKYIATNITPYTLADWSDGEIYRAITAGVGKRNNPLFPIMPCGAYGSLDHEDVCSVIAYLRTLAPIENDVPASRSDFPVNFILRLMAKEKRPGTRPPQDDTLAYGQYITTAAACIDCHTPVNTKGAPLPGMAFMGGREFPMPDSEPSVSTNITFDPETGLGEWGLDKFIHAFRSYNPATSSPKVLGEGDINTVMPWTMYAGMDTTDLTAIYFYLKSLPPVASPSDGPKP